MSMSVYTTKDLFNSNPFASFIQKFRILNLNFEIKEVYKIQEKNQNFFPNPNESFLCLEREAEKEAEAGTGAKLVRNQVHGSRDEMFEIEGKKIEKKITYTESKGKKLVFFCRRKIRIKIQQKTKKS